MFSAFADVSLWQLALVAGVALFASVIGGVSGYGTGALMPLILVPMVGAESVVPIIAIAGLTTNLSRVAAFVKFVDWRRAKLVLIGALPPCVVTAYGYTLLTGKGATLLIGSMLVATVPLRYMLKRRKVVLGDRGLVTFAAGYGVVVGGTVGAGVIVLSLLMATGLEGAAVIATDALLSIAVGVTRLTVFGFAGVITFKVLSFAVLIGCVAFPGAFLAKAFVDRLPVHFHTAILDAVVIFGGSIMIYSSVFH